MEFPPEDRLSSSTLSKVFSRALAQPCLLAQDDTAVLFYDLDEIERRFRLLAELFPPTALHAVAIKANPLRAILRHLKNMGAGAEAASLPEMYLAEEAGFLPEHIVFDSPAKTVEEIFYALSRGIHVNADSFAELDRIEQILQQLAVKANIGVRINPQIGAGAIEQTSVAGRYSKFGIPLDEYRQRLKERFLNCPWLTCVHLHIGSQGCELPLLLQGAEKIYAFVKEVNFELKRLNKAHQIQVVDLGGGLPVTYHGHQKVPTMQEYVQNLRQNLPELFGEHIRLVTEFGRYIHANAGWVASRVEYVKRDEAVNTLMVHVGADMFLRRCYRPQDWHHDISVVDSFGRLTYGCDRKKYTIAGPLCFSGDMLAREIELPVVEEGDYVLIHDAGAYTLSMWSRYNSRQMPKVVGYTGNGNSFEILKKRETLSEVADFWR